MRILYKDFSVIPFTTLPLETVLQDPRPVSDRGSPRPSFVAGPRRLSSAPPGPCLHLIRVGLHTRPFLAPSRLEPKADELEDGAELLNGLGFDVRADLTPKQGLDGGLVVATEADEVAEISPGQHDRSHRRAVDDADEEPTVSVDRGPLEEVQHGQGALFPSLHHAGPGLEVGRPIPVPMLQFGDPLEELDRLPVTTAPVGFDQSRGGAGAVKQLELRPFVGPPVVTLDTVIAFERLSHLFEVGLPHRRGPEQTLLEALVKKLFAFAQEIGPYGAPVFVLRDRLDLVALLPLVLDEMFAEVVLRRAVAGNDQGRHVDERVGRIVLRRALGSVALEHVFEEALPHDVLADDLEFRLVVPPPRRDPDLDSARVSYPSQLLIDLEVIRVGLEEAEDHVNELAIVSERNVDAGAQGWRGQNDVVVADPARRV